MIDAIKKRRSYRKFKDREIEQEKLDEILKAASYAPSARHTYPWALIVVEDGNKREKFSKVTNWSTFAADAPVVIAVASEETKEWVEDCSIVAEHIQLEARKQGLGACWIHIRGMEKDGKSSEQVVKKTLETPEGYRVLCLIAVGYPAGEKSEHDESEAGEREIYREKYGKEY